MKFGIHYLLSCSPEQSAVQRYHETLEQAVLAESLGFESIWPVEQHFNQTISALPCPTLLLAAVAARTQSLRLGTGIVQLGLNHPLRVAEEIATLDVLSRGRVEFGVGRGSTPTHFAGFNVPLAESRERMEESLRYLQQAFAQDRFSFEGRFFPAEDVCLVPRPVQASGPPISVAVNSPETAVFAGNAGLPIILALHVNPLPRAKELVALYRKTLAEAGHAADQPISLLLPLFVAEKAADAQRAVEPAVARFVTLMTTLLSANLTKWTGAEERQRMESLLERARQTTYARMNEAMAVFGTPDACAERLRCIAHELGVGRFIAWFNLAGAVSADQVTRSMHLFARTVMPHVAELATRVA